MQQQRTNMRGKIITINGQPNPNSYVIQGDDGNTYLAHIGDIQDNEELLISHYRDGETRTLAVNDTVEFDLQPEHAMHVRRASQAS